MTEGNIILKDNLDGPGLGIELDDNLIDNERGIPEWKFPEMCATDGSTPSHSFTGPDRLGLWQVAVKPALRTCR
jgi:hypothetical protein